MDTPTLLLLFLIGYFLYNYSPLGCVVNPVKCIGNEVSQVKSFFSDVFEGIIKKI
jgi:hypothetical protein